MFGEHVKIMARRFRGRILESGLLILAVALGVGAAASGISLLVNTQVYADKLLSSPEYREIVVATRSEAEDMEQPVLKRSAEAETVLTSTDLEAAELAPAVTHSYVANRMEIRLTTQSSLERREQLQSDDTIERQPGFAEREIFQEEIEKAKSDDSILISESLESLAGYNVTPEFFQARNINAQYGSLFSGSDMQNNNSLIVLGSKTAEILAGDRFEVEDLLGKKILSVDEYQTIIGILEPVDDSFDEMAFKPYSSSLAGGFGMRRYSMNTQLRFTVDDPQRLEETAVQLFDWFESQYGKGQITISNPREEAKRLIARNTGIGILILFLSVSALFIASVNVSHILMSRALRMRKYVGILMALGSSKNGILRIFGGEGLLISISGSILGIVLSIPLSNTMQQAMDLGNNNILYLFVGAILAWLLTSAFSLIPAWQHSKAEPAQAIQGGSQ